MQKDALERLLNCAGEGRTLWLELVEEYGISYDTIVYILPESDRKINEIAMKYAKTALKEKRANHLLVIAAMDEALYKEQLTSVSYKWVNVSETELDNLLKYNDMTVFSSQTIVVSFSYGSDHSIQALEGHNGITMEELVCIGILGLSTVGEENEQ